MITKREIREKFKKLRNEMTSEQVRVRSEQICRRILASECYREARLIYAYYPLGNEADIRPVLAEALKSGRRVALPRVSGKTMDYFEISDFTELKKGSFGVMEPGGDVPVRWTGALVLTPGVAFDRRGNRLGYGGGYYDRYFAEETTCVRMGVAYEAQMAEEIPVGQYDRAVDCVVTERGVCYKSQSSGSKEIGG